jgi:hypothetical protein
VRYNRGENSEKELLFLGGRAKDKLKDAHVGEKDYFY